ncbi:hypothetical protein [Kingella kingae]|uniref:hypothetical protein n=1 Tax=Kingella kingae TaxID=504 RepID=UPI0039B0CBFB
MTIERSSDNGYSEVTFLAQSHGRSGNSGKHDLKWVYKDGTITLHKPITVVVADADNLQIRSTLSERAIIRLAAGRLDDYD